MSKYFKYPFAENGDKVEIVDGMQPSGTVSYQQGWGYDYQRKLGTDPLAKPVPRQQTNQLSYDITSAIKQYQEQGFYNFITPEMNDGKPFNYSMGAVVRYGISIAQDGSDVRNFSSKINNNTGNPKENPDDWSNIDITFASNAEAQSGTIKDKVISPSSLTSVTATRDRRGLVQLATSAEALQGINMDKAVTPAGLLSIFADNSLNTNGYQVLPGGLILQWGEFLTGSVGNGATGFVNFPSSYTQKCLQVIIGATYGSTGSRSIEGFNCESFDETGFKWMSQWESRTDTVDGKTTPLRYFAIGF